jgi:hypothetical protein
VPVRLLSADGLPCSSPPTHTLGRATGTIATKTVKVIRSADALCLFGQPDRTVVISSDS